MYKQGLRTSGRASASGVFYIVCILYVLCQQKKMKSFFDEARLETNAPPLYCGVVPNICDRNPILLRFVIGQGGIVL